MLRVDDDQTESNQNLIAMTETRNAPKKKMASLRSLASALSLTEQTADPQG